MRHLNLGRLCPDSSTEITILADAGRSWHDHLSLRAGLMAGVAKALHGNRQAHHSAVRRICRALQAPLARADLARFWRGRRFGCPLHLAYVCPARAVALDLATAAAFSLFLEGEGLSCSAWSRKPFPAWGSFPVWVLVVLSILLYDGIKKPQSLIRLRQ